MTISKDHPLSKNPRIQIIIGPIKLVCWAEKCLMNTSITSNLSHMPKVLLRIKFNSLRVWSIQFIIGLHQRFQLNCQARIKLRIFENYLAVEIDIISKFSLHLHQVFEYFQNPRYNYIKIAYAQLRTIKFLWNMKQLGKISMIKCAFLAPDKKYTWRRGMNKPPLPPPSTKLNRKSSIEKG